MDASKKMLAEEKRMEDSRDRKSHWKRWGPYVSERAWGTVREDYSPNGDAWEFLLHDHARSKAYRWNEDGIAGVCDRHQQICFALALWNGNDPFLKERIFGLTGNQGNHGEDAKEYYFYLPAYEDVASKFWEHFLYIADAMCHRGPDGQSLWNEQDGFFYDVLHAGDGERFPIRVRSMVGLIPLFAVETLDQEVLNRMPSFKRRMDWFIENRPDLTANLACMRTTGEGERRLFSIVDEEKLRSILKYMLDENEFLSPYGIRALSKHHEHNPYVVHVGGVEHRVDYEPGESRTGMFGGNSNWRGPIWFPMNFLLVESLQRFHFYLGDDFKVECPTGSGHYLTLWEVAGELSLCLGSIFTRDGDGRRPVYGDISKFQHNEHWRDLILFYEYFHGDTGAGLGASHQTGWTALVAKLVQQSGEKKSKLTDIVAAVAAD